VCAQHGVLQYNKEVKQTTTVKQSLLIVDIADSASQFITPQRLQQYGLQRPDRLALLRSYAWHGFPGGCPQNSRRHEILFDFWSSSQGQLAPIRPPTPSEANTIVEGLGCPPPPEEELAQKMLLAIPFPKLVRDFSFFQHTAEGLSDVTPNRLLQISKRKIDVAFMGRVTYENAKCGAGRHRQLLIDSLERIIARRPKWQIFVVAGGTQKSKKMERALYREKLQETKIFISPHGHGEWSLKDEEAVLAGAVLLKPGAAMLKAAVPIYTPNVTCLEVRSDWAGLEEMLDWALSNEKRLQKIQQAAHKIAAPYATYAGAIQQKAILDQFAKVVKRAADFAAGAI